MRQLVSMRRARITGYKSTTHEPMYVETAFGKLALQLYRAGIK
jgi:hypothetical protein